jgi:hypothetical protein
LGEFPDLNREFQLKYHQSTLKSLGRRMEKFWVCLAAKRKTNFRTFSGHKKGRGGDIMVYGDLGIHAISANLNP